MAFTPVLKWAAAFFMIVGAWLMLHPSFFIQLLGGEQPESMLLFRWFGALIVASSLMAGLACSNPARHWLIWLGGFVALVLMIVIALPTLISGSGPTRAAWFVSAISLLWALPIGWMLMHIARAPAGGETPLPLPDDLQLDQYTTQDGRSLAQLSQERPVLLVLLRHLGCTFCRETLADLAAQRREIEEQGAQIVFVHMGEDEKTRYLFERYRLDDIPRISDPEAQLYRALGLQRASLMQIYGPGMWRYTVQSILLDGHGMGQIVGDRFQMPGVFLIHDDAVTGGFRHQRISDHPDYLSIIRVAVPSDELTY